MAKANQTMRQFFQMLNAVGVGESEIANVFDQVLHGEHSGESRLSDMQPIFAEPMRKSESNLTQIKEIGDLASDRSFGVTIDGRSKPIYIPKPIKSKPGGYKQLIEEEEGRFRLLRNKILVEQIELQPLPILREIALSMTKRMITRLTDQRRQRAIATFFSKCVETVNREITQFDINELKERAHIAFSHLIDAESPLFTQRSNFELLQLARAKTKAALQLQSEMQEVIDNYKQTQSLLLSALLARKNMIEKACEWSKEWGELLYDQP